jgi:hypothetical protein
VFHQGGMMQPLALDAYNKALELNDVDAEFVVQVNQQKGISIQMRYFKVNSHCKDASSYLFRNHSQF